MRQFILKTSIVIFAIFILFQFTIGYRIDRISKNLNIFSNQHERIKIKEKILVEMKKGSEKENLLNEEERLIISNFLRKLLIELNLNLNVK